MFVTGGLKSCVIIGVAIFMQLRVFFSQTQIKGYTMLEKELEEYEFARRERVNLQLSIVTVILLILTVTFYSESRRLSNLSTFYGIITPIVSIINIVILLLAIVCLKKGIKLLKIKKTIKVYIAIAISILLIIRYMAGIIGKIYLSF